VPPISPFVEVLSEHRTVDVSQATFAFLDGAFSSVLDRPELLIIEQGICRCLSATHDVPAPVPVRVYL
jgi:hypothetical protein